METMGYAMDRGRNIKDAEFVREGSTRNYHDRRDRRRHGRRSHSPVASPMRFRDEVRRDNDQREQTKGHRERHGRSMSKSWNSRQNNEDAKGSGDMSKLRRPGHDNGDDSGGDHRGYRKKLQDKNDSSGLSSLVKKSGPLLEQSASFALEREAGSGRDFQAPAFKDKEKANYGTTGALASASNAVSQADGSVITLKYHEPPEARRPPLCDEWRFYVFKDGEIVDTVPLSARSCWLIGREASVVDLLAAHPSISKQHAVLQFRYVERRNEYGDRLGRVRPYIIDLASANGSTLNGEAVETQRFIELRERDMVQFGQSTREYVLMLTSG